MSRRPGAAAFAAALAALLLASCTTAAGAGRARAGAASPTLRPLEPRVERAYLAYWAAWIEASGEPGTERPGAGLERYAGDPHLEVLRSALRDQARAGRVAKGSVVHHIRGMRVDGERRQVVDCVDIRGWLLYDARTGRRIPQLIDRPHQLAVSTLREVGGGWKVTDAQEPGTC